MKKKIFIAAVLVSALTCHTAPVIAQQKQPLTPEKLWELGRVSAEGLTSDRQQVVFGVTSFNVTKNNSERILYAIPVGGGTAVPLPSPNQFENTIGKEDGLRNVRLSPDGKKILFTKAVLLKPTEAKVLYGDLPQADAYVYDELHYRHWDSWNTGEFNHVFYASYDQGKIGEHVDIMEGEPFHAPQVPFGGKEDLIWAPDSESIVYVSKKKYGKDFALSTNADLYRYDLRTGETTNLTHGMMGYDTHPAFSPGGRYLSWLSMSEDGYEADKNDVVLYDLRSRELINLTENWDGTVNAFEWSNDERKIWFLAPIRGTVQLFEIDLQEGIDRNSVRHIQQISAGNHDITSIVGQSGNQLVVAKNTFNRASELFRFDLAERSLTQLTSVNDHAYAEIAESRVESRITKASDGKDLFSWVVYPPDFDPNKKYPTLLYCQGGPQSALTQFYSFRWNLQLIAAHGYIVIAPNRRGMPGHGVEWNEAISGDWGGQPIRDYLSAIDDISQEPYVDKDRLGAVGASYGGYSVFMLAGVHEGRFKSFISHCGLYDTRSWYGTTEELFFANKDFGGPYWESENQKIYQEFNPLTHVEKWDTPILIIQGGKDYRVPIEQGLQAYQAAQLRNIPSKLLYFPGENHWILSPQNAMVWQREFFSWLEKTL